MKSLLTIAAFTGCAASAWAETFSYNHENVLGTSLELRVDASTEAVADAAEARVLAAVDRLAKVLSTYQADSEINRWAAEPAGPVEISTDLHAVLAACDTWESKSGGVFNARIEAITQVWKRAAKAQAMPSAEDLSAAVALAKSPAWKLTDATHAERLGACPISISALAKGYIIEQAGASAYDPEHGVTSVLLNIGGDLKAWGKAQTVSIANPTADAENADPLARVTIQNQSLATSGNYRRGTTIAGHHQSHILDPRTGQPADEVWSASVIAPDATSADALATIFSVMNPSESLALAETLSGVQCLIVTEHGTFHSTGWKDLNHTWSLVQAPAAAPETKDAPPAPSGKSALDNVSHDVLVPERTWTNTEGKTMVATLLSVTEDAGKFRLKSGAVSEVAFTKLSAEDQKVIQTAREAAAAGWGGQHEVVVNYEINAVEGGRYHRPYVAIWLEDKDGFPIRTIALLMQAGPQRAKIFAGSQTLDPQ